MPNWCVGTLKVRGEKEDIKRFLTDGLKPIVPVIASILAHMKGEETEVKEPSVEIEEDEYSITLTLPKEADGFHVKGTYRNFIESREIEWYYDEILKLDYRGAWSIDTAALTEISKEYNLDFRIYAFERGMEFNVEFEVSKGNVINNHEIKFDDYEWECICPELGG